MPVGYMQVLHHFIQGTWASEDFVITGGPITNLPMDTEGQLYKHQILLHFTEQSDGLFLWFSGKESICKAGATGDEGLITGLERPPGEVNGNPLWYSCLENPMDRGAWQLQSIGSRSQTQLKWFSTYELSDIPPVLKCVLNLPELNPRKQ